MNLKEYFLNRKPAETLVMMHRTDQEVYNSKICREIDTTYSHTVEIIQKLESEDLIRTEKKGRKKISVLTEQGEDCAKSFDNLFQTLDEDRENTIEH